MSPFEMVVWIVAIMGVTGIMRARYGAYGTKWRMRQRDGWHDEGQADAAEQERLHEEFQALKERVAVLERIVTDKSLGLADEIEKLRDERVS
jgi:hypothetical protein